MSPGLSASRFTEAGSAVSEPRIQTQQRTYQVEAGAEVTLECRVQHLGNMVLMWKQVRGELPSDTSDTSDTCTVLTNKERLNCWFYIKDQFL